jgi:uncharacterized protein
MATPTSSLGNEQTLARTEPTKVQDLVQIAGVIATKEWFPSRFNARSKCEDGTLVLYNSLTGAFSGFPPQHREKVESFLHRGGKQAKPEGLTKYLQERGFIVEKGVDEFSRMRIMYGNMQYRPDVLELILLASEECNFRCVYCYETFPRGVMEPWVRSSIIQMVERRAPGLNVLKVSWFGGEPLLGYDAIKEIGPALQDISKEHKISYNAEMTTNAYLLTPDVVGSLLGWGIRGYQITVDGTPEAHDEKRHLKDGGGTFDRIFANLKAMHAMKNEDFAVSLRINFDRQNIPSMNGFMDMLKRELGDDKRFQLRFYPIGQWGGPNDDQMEVCGVSRGSETQALQIQAHQKGLNVESNLSAMQPQTGSGVCYAARPYNLLIGADGKIMKCTIALDTKDYNIVGHMTRDGRADIDIDKLARWVTPYYEDDAACRTCFYVPVCQGCSCPLVRIEDNTRPCPDEKTKIGKSLTTLWALRQDKASRFSISTETLHPPAEREISTQSPGSVAGG